MRVPEHYGRGFRRVLVLAAVVSTLLAATLGVLAPPDAVQGSWQKLMYVHVPAAWTAYLAFVLVLVASVAFLRTGRPRFDAAALAAAEIGVVATSVALVTGSIWGRAVWGVWWTWDARLVSTALMLVLYVAYLGVRGLGGDVHDVRRLAAWVAIVAFADVPVVHFSVLWWRTLHQPPTILAPRAGTPPIDARMAVALLAAVLAACLVAAYAFGARVTRLLGLDRPAKDRPARLALVPPPVVPAPAEPVEPVARPADPVPR